MIELDTKVEVNAVDNVLPPGTVVDFALIDVQFMDVEAM
jgi:hypothetical protein